MASEPISTSSDALLGRVAVAAKLITMDQLAQATREQGRPGNEKSLGEVLVELGFMTQATLRKALDLQRAVLQRAQEKQSGGAQPTLPKAKPAYIDAELGQDSDERATETHASTARGRKSGPKTQTGRGKKDRTPTGRGGSKVGLGRIDTKKVSSAHAVRSAPRNAFERGLDPLLVDAAGQRASDIHLHSGTSVRLRVRGALTELKSAVLTRADAERLILPILSAGEREQLEQHGEIDLCHTVKGLARFRVNVYRQVHGLDATFRRITLQPPTLDDLGLPSALAKFTNYHQGMVLVTGPTSCGKSSTLAALVNLINEERAEHILTIEDPIEYLHPSKRCVVNQRNVRRHTESFARALRAGLREDPDVIVIGELRDRETISLALTAAETGHFVLATLHTDNAVRTVNRIVGAFPPDQQDQVRGMLAESLRAVISQRLLPRSDGRGMTPATEVLVVNRAVGNLIRKNESVQIRSTMQTGTAQGMNLLDASLVQLVRSGTVRREDALVHAEDPKLIPAWR